MKEKLYHVLRDKLFLVLLVVGLLTLVAAAGIVTLQKNNKLDNNNKYLEQPGDDYVIQETPIMDSQMADNTQPQYEEHAAATKAEEVKVADNKSNEDLTEVEKAAEVGANKDAASAVSLNFTDTSKLSWPVTGNVIMDYSMDKTTYFATLDQYKCNPAIIIQGAVSTPVLSSADARVLQVGQNEEIGNFVVLDFGNDYTAIVGQLKETQVVENEYITKGKTLGYVAEPSKYYSVEGNNLYFQLKNKDKSIDPLDYLE